MLVRFEILKPGKFVLNIVTFLFRLKNNHEVESTNISYRMRCAMPFVHFLTRIKDAQR